MGVLSNSILLLCLSYLVYAQGDTRCRQTARDLIDGGCSVGCVTVTRESFPCPVCMDQQDTCRTITDQCNPRNSSTCGRNQVCLAGGENGLYSCSNFLGEGAPCNVESDEIDDVIERARDFLSGINSREALSEVIDAVLPCQSGLVCRRVTVDRRECMPEVQGPCVIRRATNPELDCDDDGNFEPVQCVRLDTGRYRCRCVVESSGDAVPDTEREVEERSDAPDCEDIVNDRCRYRSRLGRLYEVRSGMTFVNPTTCQRCLCDNGQSTLCTTAREDCRDFNPEPRGDRSCRLRGRTVEEGDSVEIGCNVCGCRNGAISCTRRDCDDDDDDDDEEDIGENPDDPEEDRNCRRCVSMRASPVCGSDGRTYPSSCFAMNCRGLESDDIIPGPCSRRNICERFPCEDGEVCFRTGGVTCMSSSGCSQERLRRCVTPAELRCRSRDDDDDEEDEDENESGGGEEDSESSDSDSDSDEQEDRERVCGNDGRTYPSVCTLLQNAAGTQVAYAGSCNQTECLGGEVCGTDGQTYDNICDLRTNSANARVDYLGACMDSGDVVRERCQQVRESGRCPSLEGCTSRIQPADGCCPICGGAMTIRFDPSSLDEFIRLNPELETIDDFVKALVADGFISADILSDCMIAANLLDTGELHVVLEGESICRNFLERAVDRINNPDTSTTIPQILQSAVIADSAPLVEDGGNIPPSSGAIKLLPLTLVLMLLPAITLFL